MKDCNEIRLLFVEALYDDLSDDAQTELQEHLRQCNRCASIYRRMEKTATVMHKRQRPDPGEEFWNGYWDRLSERMQPIKPARRPHWWMMRAAAVLFLIGVGVVIGRFYFRTIPPSPNVSVATRQIPLEASKVDQRVNHFLGRSEVLLLGLVNLNPEKGELSAINWQQQKKISQDLVQEAKSLQSELASPEQRRLQKLVSDLEVILLQIANLEAQHDMPEIELVKSGVDRKAVLLKINLEQMRSAPEQKPDSSRRKNAL